MHIPIICSSTVAQLLPLQYTYPTDLQNWSFKITHENVPVSLKSEM